MEETRPKRILRLLMMLSGSRRYSMPELEEKLGMSRRNIRRDLQFIESSGLLLDREGGYRFLADKSANRNLKNLLHFSEEETSNMIIKEYIWSIGMSSATRMKRD